MEHESNRLTISLIIGILSGLLLLVSAIIYGTKEQWVQFGVFLAGCIYIAISTFITIMFLSTNKKIELFKNDTLKRFDDIKKDIKNISK